ncbi:MAG: CRISPR-associated protein, partial [Selenomonadaceae bacterium]|nr:CRISPR-associated protein [Selenomonadaceae bacterium]
MNSSSVIGKILIEGEFILKSPLLIGDGAGETADNFRDVHVLKNRQGEPFIPGTSLCGVLCDWLENLSPAWTTKIFGD